MLIQKKANFMVDLVAIFLIGIVCFLSKTDYASPIYADEMGYLSNAALMAGLDWSDAVQNLPYYGYGVSILYVPLFGLFDSVDLIYVGVKIINTLLLLQLYYVAKKVLLDIYGKDNHIQCVIVAAICCCSSYLMTARNFALSEVPLASFYFLSVLLFVKYIETNKQIWKICLLVIVTYILMIHVRTIGSFCVTIFMLLCYDYKNASWNERLRKWLVTIVIAVIGVSLCFGIKELFVSSGGAGSISTINDFSGQSGKIAYLLTKDGFRDLWVSVGTKLWSFGVGYFLVPFVGIIHVAKLLFKNKNRFLMLFLVLAFSSEFAINCAYLAYIDRTDMIFYTRYSEFAVLPFFCVGLMQILNSKWKWVTVISVLLWEVALTGAVMYAETAYECSKYLAACMPNMMFWWEGNYVNYKLVFELLGLIIIGLYLLREEIKYIVVGMIIAIWIMSSNISYVDYEKCLSLDILYGCREAAEYIRECEYEKVYVVGDDSWDGMHNPCWIQYFLPEIEVEIIDVAEAESRTFWMGEVMVSSAKIYQDYDFRMDCVYETDRFCFIENGF